MWSLSSMVKLKEFTKSLSYSTLYNTEQYINLPYISCSTVQIAQLVKFTLGKNHSPVCCMPLHVEEWLAHSVEW